MGQQGMSFGQRKRRRIKRKEQRKKRIRVESERKE